jgi:hypothetical protein
MPEYRPAGLAAGKRQDGALAIRALELTRHERGG